MAAAVVGGHDASEFAGDRDRGAGARCAAASRPGILAPGEAPALAERIRPDGALAGMRRRLLDPSGTIGAGTAWARPHPSWFVRAAAGLPPAVARLYLDRLAPEIGRGTLAHLDPTLAAALAAAQPAAPSDATEELIGRFAPGPFPPPPAWAVPPAPAERIAAAAARDDGPWSPELDDAPAAALDARVADPAVRRGLARLAIALLDAPDEAWGLAGSWIEVHGLALLRARNAWLDVRLAAGASWPVGVERAARERVRERWREWAG